MQKQSQQSDDSFSITAEELEEIRRGAYEKAMRARHEWRQKGDWIECKSDACAFRHRAYIGVKKVLVGIDNKGMPILEDIK